MQDDDEQDDFRREVADAEPLPDHGRAPLERRRPAPRARFRRQAEREVLEETLAAPVGPEHLDDGEQLSFRRDHLSQKAFRRLRRGGIPVMAEIDLHGLTREQARRALAAFLADPPLLDGGCLRVITGRGASSPGGVPVLRPLVTAWLRRDRRVLAYAPTRQADGGAGAFYVLLRDPSR